MGTEKKKPEKDDLIKAIGDATRKLPENDCKAAIPYLWTAATKRPGKTEAERLKRLATIAAIKKTGKEEALE